MTTYEPRKLILEPFSMRTDVFNTDRSETQPGPDQVKPVELKALQPSNEQLMEQSASLQSRIVELKTYAHTIAHDLKNPLAVIISSCDSITQIADLNPVEIHELLMQISNTAYEMNGIIDNLLLLSEVDRESIPAEPVDMARIIGKVRRRLQNLAKEYHGRILCPKNWPVAIGYAPWIEEVWANYISNALKYGGRPPRVELGASRKQGGMLCFWTRDNGTGIPKETQARLFNPVTQPCRGHLTGHGLGLSIVRHIVEKLGGQVGVESEAGQGSLFYFTLPSCLAKPENRPKKENYL